MASVNNIYLLAGDPFKQYVKTIPSTVAGMRLDPGHAEPRLVGFVLESLPDGFDTEAEVLAVYSQREDDYLQQANRALFRLGMLKEYAGDSDKPAIDYSNFLSDDEVKAVASLKTVAALRSRLSDITSYFTASRIVKAAEDMGIKKSLLDIMRARQAELAS